MYLPEYFTMKALIFDFDGTIANTLPIIFAKTIQISKKYKINKEAREILNLVSQLPLWLLLKELKISWVKIPSILWEVKQAREEMFTEIEHTQLFDGMKELLTELVNRGIKLYIYSSNSHKNVIKFLEKEKIISLFKKIYIGGGLFGKSKGLIKILKRENLTNEEVFYVTDEIRDVLACQKVNIRVIGVNWGLAGAEALSQAQATFIIKKPAEILEIIDKYDKITHHLTN